MLLRPTDDDCIRYGARAALARAWGRRRIPGRGPGGRRARGGGGGAPDPLLALFTGTDGIYVDWTNVDLVGSDIDVAYDKSPYAHVFTAGTRPEYIAADADFGNKPSASFSATTIEYLIAEAASALDLGGGSLDMFAVMKGTASGGPTGAIINKRVSDGWQFGYQSTTGIALIRDSTLGAGTASITFAAAGTSRESVTLVRGLYNDTDAGGTYYARINGTSGTGVTTGQGGTCTNANTAAIGARNGGVSPFDGKVAFIFGRIGGGIFSAAERAIIVAQVNARYGTSFS